MFKKTLLKSMNSYRDFLKESQNKINNKVEDKVNNQLENKEYDLEYLKDFYIKSKDKDLNCPKCDSNDKAYILYGMPYDKDNMLKQAVDKNIVVFGGCIINEFTDSDGYVLKDYKYKCNNCGEKFHRERVKKIRK